MSKVSVGLRGWRFEESEIFTPEGEFKPLDEIPEEPRERLLRLTKLVEEPCDACYLEYGEEEVQKARQAEIVYGEPLGEVLLCPAHEADFLYWFREAGGDAHRGDPELSDAFHEWYAAGNRAPEGYGGIDHVDDDPEGVPEPPDQKEVQRRLEEEFEGRRIDLHEYGPDDGDEFDPEDRLTAEDLSESDLDLSTDYPSDS
ncbi:hypothetical protein [Haloparvum sedimenti]|uniref:hypothetical protein n=1 Tax=Haloparvum sedimenti TaxID=1678448 RepID=UPI00071E7A54|nr:hypothetical protein [Haloparvum sedimenti]